MLTIEMAEKELKSLYGQQRYIVDDIKTLADLVINNHDAGKSYKAVLAGLRLACKELLEIESKLEGHCDEGKNRTG